MSAKHPTIALTLTLLLVLSLAGPAWGQESDDDPPIPVNQYGTPDMDNIDLNPSYTYSDRVVIADLPVVGEVGIDR
jgi:hypothetical protein